MREGLISQMITVALAWRYLVVMALPRPLAPPVMRAVLLDRSAMLLCCTIDIDIEDLQLSAICS